MLEVSSAFLSFMISYIADCIIFKKMINSKINMISIKNIILIAVMSIISCFIDMNYGDLPKLIFFNMQICIVYKLVFDTSTLKAILVTISIVISSGAAELIFISFCDTFLGIDASFFMDDIIGSMIGNFSVTILYCVLLMIKPIKWCIQQCINFYNNSKLEIVILLAFIMTLTAGITYPIIMTSSLREKITYSLIFIAFVYFIGNFFYQRSKNGELKKEYDYLLDYVKEYEKALDEKSKAQHESKNQLVVIKSLANKNNTKLHKYIDEILDVEESKESHLLNSLRILPTCGLKGLIYYKTAKMFKKGMEVHVNVESILQDEKYWELCEKHLHSVSTVIGVYLDNAIEAAEKADKKFVIIDIDADGEDVIFSFSNTYEGHIDVGKMDKQGYSTKGKSRGYGLSLVQDILNKSEYLSQKREINGIFYVQKLIIQNKK